MATETKNAGVSRFHVQDNQNTSVQGKVLEFASEAQEAEDGEHEHSIARPDLYRIVFVAVAAASLWFLKTTSTPASLPPIRNELAWITPRPLPLLSRGVSPPCHSTLVLPASETPLKHPNPCPSSPAFFE